jgi:hypothetical protein
METLTIGAWYLLSRIAMIVLAAFIVWQRWPVVGEIASDAWYRRGRFKRDTAWHGEDTLPKLLMSTVGFGVMWFLLHIFGFIAGITIYLVVQALVIGAAVVSFKMLGVSGVLGVLGMYIAFKWFDSWFSGGGHGAAAHGASHAASHDASHAENHGENHGDSHGKGHDKGHGKGHGKSHGKKGKKAKGGDHHPH